MPCQLVSAIPLELISSKRIHRSSFTSDDISAMLACVDSSILLVSFSRYLLAYINEKRLVFFVILSVVTFCTIYKSKSFPIDGFIRDKSNYHNVRR
jgi:hypothetical protein